MTKKTISIASILLLILVIIIGIGISKTDNKVAQLNKLELRSGSLNKLAVARLELRSNDALKTPLLNNLTTLESLVPASHQLLNTLQNGLDLNLQQTATLPELQKVPVGLHEHAVLDLQLGDAKSLSLHA